MLKWGKILNFFPENKYLLHIYVKKIKNLYFLKSSGKNESKSISANSWPNVLERTKNPLQVVQVPELLFCRVQISPKQLCVQLRNMFS